MMGVKKDSESFLREHGLDASLIDPKRELSKLLAEMEEAYQGKERSVKMIPYFIGKYRPPKEERHVTVVDIGGTNVRSAVVTIGMYGSCLIEDYRSFPRPDGMMTTARFFDEIALQMKGQLETGKLGICFSLATIPQPDGDAVITAGGKQIQISDMLGKKVGESFREAARRTGAGTVRDASVVNDTVAVTLGGASFRKENAFAGQIGFVYGTGVNMAYTEPDGRLVNTEMGAYGGFPTGNLDDAFDAALIDPGLDRFEKMVSGGYQGGLAALLIQAAVREGCLNSPSFGNPLKWQGLSSRDISAFSLAPVGENKLARACQKEQDRDFLVHLFDGLSRRSALLCSIALTACMRRSLGKTGIEDRPPFPGGYMFQITAEGSTFEKQAGFATYLDTCLHSLAGESFGYTYQINQVKDAVLRGIAAACL